MYTLSQLKIVEVNGIVSIVVRYTKKYSTRDSF